jgi:hypothetical protein
MLQLPYELLIQLQRRIYFSSSHLELRDVSFENGYGSLCVLLLLISNTS